MPFCYGILSGKVLENHAMSATPNTPIDAAFVKPGASRVAALIAAWVQGKGAALTALSGLSFRFEQWTGSASSAGTAITPAPMDNRAPAAVATAAWAATAAGAVTSGTTGPNFVGGFGCGASGPGGWTAPNPDAAIALDGGAAKSTDLFAESPTASLNYEAGLTLQE